MTKVTKVRSGWEIRQIMLITTFIVLIGCDGNLKKRTPIDTALEITERITDEYERNKVISFLIIYYADIGHYNTALELTNSVQDLDERERNLQQIMFKYMEQKEYTMALETANLMQNLEIKAYSLHWIANYYARIDSSDQVLYLLQRSLDVTRQISSYRDKAQLLCFIAQSYSNINDIDQTKILLSEAYRTIAMAPDTNWLKPNSMIYLAKEYIDLGDTATAIDILGEAFILTKNVMKGPFLDLRMADITQQYARARKYDKAIESTSLIDGEEQKNRALRYIAHQHVLDGNIQKAWIIASSMEEEYSRSQIMIDIAKEHILDRQYEKAIALVDSLNDKFSQAAVLEKIAAYIIKIDTVSDARPILEKAYATLSSVENSYFHVMLLNRIAQHYTTLEDSIEAYRILKQSQRMVHDLKDEHARSLALYGTVIGYIGLNKIEEALVATESISYLYLKISSLIDIQEKLDEMNYVLSKSEQRLLNEILIKAQQVVDSLFKESNSNNKRLKRSQKNN